MGINIIKVGNLKGLRLPKSILNEYNIGNSVEMVLKEGFIEIRPKVQPRQNWKEEFGKMKNDSNEEIRINDFFEDEEV